MVKFKYKNIDVYEELTEIEDMVIHDDYLIFPVEIGFYDEDYAIWFENGIVYLVTEDELASKEFDGEEWDDDEELVIDFKSNLKRLLEEGI